MNAEIIAKALASVWLIRSAARAAAKHGPNRDDDKRRAAVLAKEGARQP